MTTPMPADRGRFCPLGPVVYTGVPGGLCGMLFIKPVELGATLVDIGLMLSLLNTTVLLVLVTVLVDDVLVRFLMMVSPSAVTTFFGHLFNFVCLIRPFL